MPVEPRPAASVLVLRDGDDGIEMLFVRRSPELKFMGGAWVFPGGTLLAEDGDPDETTSPGKVAGARETFEEARITLPDPAAARARSAAGSRPSWRRCASTPASTWRVAPEGAEPAPDRREVDRAEWWTPAKALHLFVKDEADLHFPTIKQVEQIAEFSNRRRRARRARATRRSRRSCPASPRRDEGFEDSAARRPGLRRRRHVALLAAWPARARTARPRR